jgi:hypothetical protein
MNLRVSFMGVIASLTGEKELALAFDETPTLRGLLDELERRYGAEFGARVWRSAKPPRLLQMCTRIFINGNLVDEKALDVTIPDASKDGTSSEVLVYLLPAACGG